MHTKEEKLKAFERLLDVQERLRRECPWDKAQTFESLRPNTIEETFELCDALMKNDHAEICKELGDVMEHVILYAVMGSETGDFDIADVCNHQADKLMFRHDFINWSGWTLSNPDMVVDAEGHVNYKADNDEPSEEGDAAGNKPQSSTQVESSWEKRKRLERDGNKTVLSGVPDALPSIIKAYRIQDKARNVGFDWKEPHDVWAKVREELGELETEIEKGDKEASTIELGDFIFSVINAARLYHLNPDNALEHANRKFISRFTYIEQKSKEKGKSIKDLSLDEMDKYWNEAKRNEK
jgi:uncharacterized protein YabN with tetrapyrrole methylase and pyrophosphatase domain